MSDYISRKEALVALSHLLKDIKGNPIGDGASPFADGIWRGERACAMEAILRIKSLPAADVRPVVREKWLAAEYCHGAEGYEEGWFERRAISGDAAYCSKCGEFARLDEAGAYVLSNFCPNCGADMRGKESNGET